MNHGMLLSVLCKQISEPGRINSHHQDSYHKKVAGSKLRGQIFSGCCSNPSRSLISGFGLSHIAGACSLLLQINTVIFWMVARLAIKVHAIVDPKGLMNCQHQPFWASGTLSTISTGGAGMTLWSFCASGTRS